MFLQETKTKRGGKTYTSYLVRESFRTSDGPRGRTICNLTQLPKEVRDLVGQALRGAALVPIDRLEVNNIHSFGGCVVLEDAARRHGLPALLAALSPRNGALAQAMIFGGLLFAPSATPFEAECRAARLAMFCGLEPEHFEPGDLMAALRELDERWPQICAMLLRAPHAEARAITLFRTSSAEMGALGMDGEGIPVPLMGAEAGGLPGFLQQMGRQSKGGAPLLCLDQETAARLRVETLHKQPYLIELGAESLAALLRQLNPAQLLHALREGGPIEARHHGERYILAPSEQQSALRMGSLKDLASMTTPAAVTAFCGVTTNVPAERLPAAAALEWAQRARTARGAFAPMQIVMGQAGQGSAAGAWRNHQNLQFLTHRLRCQLHMEWRARGETRPVEEVLRDLQEVHRATLTVDGVVVRRMATHPSKTVAALLSRLRLWELFESGAGK